MTQAAPVEAPRRPAPVAAARVAVWPLASIVVLAAALRFAGLDAQSFWHDEAATVELVDGGFGEMLADIPDQESTPPLYYLLAWPWAQLFGAGEVGLRFLSALLGVALVPVAYLIGRELAGRRAGLIAAALVAVSPYLVWYSQEARGYALYALLGALSFLFFLRALDAPRGRALGLWAATSALALAANYFAAFLVVPEAIWLLVALGRRRDVVAAAGAVVLAGAALLPLALAQGSAGRNEWTDDAALAARVADTAKRFLTGPFGTSVDALAVLAALLAAAGLWLLFTRAAPRERGRAALALGIGACVVAIPLLLALAGLDYYFDRYLIAALPIFLSALAVGFAAAAAGRRGLVLAVALAAVLAGISVSFQVDEELQRDDWRAAADALGSSRGGRAIVVDVFGSRPLGVYLAGDRGLPPEGAAVRELVLAESFRTGHRREPLPPRVPGFTLVERREGPTYRLMRYEAAGPVHLTRDALRPYALDETRFYLHQP